MPKKINASKPKIKKPICFQCQVVRAKLEKVWNGQLYCRACIKWNEEAEQSGIADCYRFISTFCQNCGQCNSCQQRAQLNPYSTADLLIEVINRADYEALINWENDGFQHRIQEIIWELKESQGMSPAEIEKAVNQDIFETKFSRRKKYSRGV